MSMLVGTASCAAFADDRSPPRDDRQTHVRTTRALFSNFVGGG